VTVDRSFVDRNEASRERLTQTIAGLSPEDLERSDADGWSVKVLLVHLAFWDRFVASRWRHAARTGRTTPLDIPDEAGDLINESAAAGWAAVAADRAPELALAAAGEADELIQALPDEAVGAVLEEGRPRLLDRSIHRSQHLDAIDRLIRPA
jgi:hypothetical protein